MKEKGTKHRVFDFVLPDDHKNASRQIRVSHREAFDDAELETIFHELAQTLFQIMEPNDANILMRSELLGQTLSKIATETGCTRAEATRRLNHAKRCFCELVALTLAPAKSE